MIFINLFWMKNEIECIIREAEAAAKIKFHYLMNLHNFIRMNDRMYMASHTQDKALSPFFLRARATSRWESSLKESAIPPTWHPTVRTPLA